jgi:hypothetical protein
VVLVLVLIGSGELSSRAYASTGPSFDAKFSASIPETNNSDVSARHNTRGPVANSPGCAANSGAGNLARTRLARSGADCWVVDYLPGITPLEAPFSAPAAPVSEPLVEAISPAAPRALSPIELFIAGYVATGGPQQHLDRLVHRVIPCESAGNPRAFSALGPYYGLLQFLPSTWYSAGGGDWFDPWQQGANTARLLLREPNPASQWPVCWFR